MNLKSRNLILMKKTDKNQTNNTSQNDNDDVQQFLKTHCDNTIMAISDIKRIECYISEFVKSPHDYSKK